MFWMFHTCLALMVRVGTVSRDPWACSAVQAFIGYKVKAHQQCAEQHGLSQACAERSPPAAVGSSAFSENSPWAQETLEWPGHLFLCFGPKPLYLWGHYNSMTSGPHLSAVKIPIPLI